MFLAEHVNGHFILSSGGASRASPRAADLLHGNPLRGAYDSR